MNVYLPMATDTGDTGELGEVLRHRIVDRHTALVDQRHHRRRREPFAGRRDRHDRVLVVRAVAAVAQHPTVAHDEQRGTGEPVSVDPCVDRRIDTGESGRIGGTGGTRSRPGGAGADQQGRDAHDDRHGHHPHRRPAAPGSARTATGSPLPPPHDRPCSSAHGDDPTDRATADPPPHAQGPRRSGVPQAHRAVGRAFRSTVRAIRRRQRRSRRCGSAPVRRGCTPRSSRHRSCRSGPPR